MRKWSCFRIVAFCFRIALFSVVSALPMWADLNVRTCAPAPAMTQIEYQDLVNCAVTTAGQSQLFTFPAQAGDAILIDLANLDTPVTTVACFRVIPPSGIPDKTNCAYIGLGNAYAPTVELDTGFTVGGTYTIQVFDSSGTKTFHYALAVVKKMPVPSDAIAISYGKVNSESVTPRGNRDLFIITGSAGDTLNIVLTRTSGNLVQCFSLISPDVVRTNICAYVGLGNAYAPTASADIKLLKSGSYELQVWASGHIGTFSYNLVVQCFGICPSTQSPQPSAITITTTSPLLPGMIGVAYAQTFAAMGGTPPYSNWNVAAGNMPAGLSLNSATGLLSGIPSIVSGTFNFTVAVNDSSGNMGSLPVQLSIQPAASIFAGLGRIGSFGQVVSGGGWKTTMTLINLLPVTVNAQINLYTDTGNALTLPLRFPQSGLATSGSSVNWALRPNQSLTVESDASTAPVNVGWADVQATAALSGYSISRSSAQGVPDLETTVLLDRRLSSSLVLPYDNTHGYQTGVALANQASTAATITAILLDQNGVQLASTAIQLSPFGHVSFFLTSQFSQSINQQGIVQLQSSGGLTGVSVRFSPSGSFTTVPIIQ